jgi:HlyD family secretion protein
MNDQEKNQNFIVTSESLDLLSSPEQLDQLMKVIKPLDWLTLLTFGGVIMAGLAWGIWGRIPIVVEGKGILLQPRQMVEFQATVAGQLQSLEVKLGECVKKDQILARVDPVELRQELDLTQNQRRQLQNQVEDGKIISSQRLNRETEAIASSRQSLEQRLQTQLSLTPLRQEEELKAIDQQIRSLEQRLNNAKSLVPIMTERLNNLQNLQQQGAISKEVIFQVQQEYIKAQENVTQIEAEITTLEVKKTEIKSQYLANMNEIKTLESQIKELDAQLSRIKQDDLGTNNQQQKELQEVERNIIRLQQQITLNSRIVSPQSGCLVELNTNLGQVIQPGMRLGYLQITEDHESLKAIAYLPIKEGKRIKSGMKVIINLDTLPSERFGGMIGEVTTISALPVTRESVVATVGNADLAQTLLDGNNGMIYIETDLKRDPNHVTGYQWTSSTEMSETITNGTTATIEIMIEERSPISFVLPFLREISKS